MVYFSRKILQNMLHNKLHFSHTYWNTLTVYSPLIHNQNWKNSARYSSGIYQEKLATKSSKVSCFLWVRDPWNFRNSFFVKDFYLNLNYFRVLQTALLKNEKKNLLIKDGCHLKSYFTNREAEGKHWKTRKENESWDKVNSNK